MARINLQVPFSEKDEAKRLGARWDAGQKVWYIPDGLSSTPFQKWLRPTATINIKSSYYGIATSAKSCWKCGKTTTVYGFMLPPGHETLDETEANGGAAAWTRKDEPTTLFYVEHLPEAAKNLLATLTKHYRVDYSSTTQSSYWMNHCEHCGMKQGDFDMFCEPGGAFCPMDEQDDSRVSVQLVQEPFESYCSNTNDDVIII